MTKGDELLIEIGRVGRGSGHLVDTLLCSSLPGELLSSLGLRPPDGLEAPEAGCSYVVRDVKTRECVEQICVSSKKATERCCCEGFVCTRPPLL